MDLDSMLAEAAKAGKRARDAESALGAQDGGHCATAPKRAITAGGHCATGDAPLSTVTAQSQAAEAAVRSATAAAGAAAAVASAAQEKLRQEQELRLAHQAEASSVIAGLRGQLLEQESTLARYQADLAGGMFQADLVLREQSEAR